MEPTEHTLQKTTLEQEFATLAGEIVAKSTTEAEKTFISKRYRFPIRDAASYKERLLALGAVESPGGPVDQTDSYFLYPGETPEFTTETLCYRQENGYVDYSHGDPQDSTEIGKLVYKSYPNGRESDASRTIRRVVAESFEDQYNLLERIKEIRGGNDFAPYVVNKKRTTYILPTEDDSDPIVVQIDEGVRVKSYSEEEKDLPEDIGDFLQVYVPDSRPNHIKRITSLLDITGQPIDAPYIARRAFVEALYSTRYNTIQTETPDNPEFIWLNTTHAPYYYDAGRDEFVVGIDPKKIKGLDTTEQGWVLKEVRNICTNLDNANGGHSLPSEVKLPVTYEKRPNHDGFLNRPNIRAHFASAEVWRIRYEYKNLRLVFSRVVFKEEPPRVGIFIHLIGSHKDYDIWLKRHAINH